MASSQQQHYFVTSCAEWRVGTDLAKLKRAFERDGLEFGVWRVPAPLDAEYEIQCYRPMVEGAEFLGKFRP